MNALLIDCYQILSIISTTFNLIPFNYFVYVEGFLEKRCQDNRNFP